MPSPLTVNDYDRAEAAALASAPNLVIAQVSSVVFDRIGYPMRIREDRAAVRYVDVMHETRFAHNIDSMLGGLTDAELELLVKVNLRVADLTGRLYGQRSFTTGSAARALVMLRNIETLYGDRKLTVLEVGPGSGYLGAFLILKGHKYVATDVTQAMYLYQNHLWGDLLGDRFHELATEDADVGGLLSSEGPVGVHIPWWKYLTLHTSERLFPVDVVTASHVLCEMPVDGRAYTIRLARRLLDGGGEHAAFVFEGWGAEGTAEPWNVTSQFWQAGFIVRHDSTLVTVVEPWPVQHDFSKARRALRLARRALLRNMGLPVSSPRPPVTQAPWVEEAVRSADAARATQRRHGSAQVTEALKSALGTQNLMSPDERFAAFVGRSYV
jgi:SAM-dependent methyltransferase